jgi:DNA polymerase V
MTESTGEPTTARGYPRTTGFASPAEDYFEKPLDLHDLLVPHPQATFLFPITSEGPWDRSGALLRGDLLLVDRSLDAAVGRTVLASLEGELALGRLRAARGLLLLEGAQGRVLDPESDGVRFQGVVTAVLRPLLEGTHPHLSDGTHPSSPPGSPLPDLNDLLIPNPLATYFAYVEGRAHTRAGIHAGDVLVVDRALDAADGRYIIAFLQGRLSLRRVEVREGRCYLHAGATSASPAAEIAHEELPDRVWGVASWALHSLFGPFPHVSREAPP